MTIGYTQHGTGPERVLVMHGWGGDHTYYEPTMPYLDTSAFTYVFVDLRGYGTSRDMAGEYTVEEISGDCLDVADALGWDRFDIVGHSMTGMATQRIALDAPERVASAIAVCPVSAAGIEVDDETWQFYAQTTEDDGAFLEFLRFGAEELPAQWPELKLQENRATSVAEARLGYLKMFTRTNFADAVAGLETPFLVLVTEHDPPGLDGAAMQETFLAWHPNAELGVIPNCAHYPMQECPPFFAKLIEDFLLGQADTG